MFPEKDQFKNHVLAKSLLKVTKTVIIKWGLFNSMVGYIYLVFLLNTLLKKNKKILHNQIGFLTVLEYG